MCTAVADEKYFCHILKPLEWIDIPVAPMLLSAKRASA